MSRLRSQRQRLVLEPLEDRTLLYAGFLDPTFGTGGMVRTDFNGSGADSARAVAAQADGKIVVAGSTSDGRTSAFALARYLPTGALDPGFGTGGRVTTTFENPFGPGGIANAVLVQPDGKIVAAGSTSGSDTGFALARYNPDGSLDSGFGLAGKVTVNFRVGSSSGQAFSVLLQPNGKILATGGCGNSPVMARLNPDGSLDAGFGNGGRVGSCNVSSVSIVTTRTALQPDGKIVTVSGTSASISEPPSMKLERYEVNGVRDVTFGGRGEVPLGLIGLASQSAGLGLQADGKILVAGRVRDDVVAGRLGEPFVVVRFQTDGNLDTTFGTAGRKVVDAGDGDTPSDLLVQPDGTIVVGRNLTVTRLLPNGAPNTSFGVAGKVHVPGEGLGSPVTVDGAFSGSKLVVAGTAAGTAGDTDFLVLRFDLADGYATPNQRYVGQLYLNLLNRSADAGGHSFFVDLLDRGVATRAQVAQAFTGSEEYRTVTVKNLYRTLLRREADQGGLNAFVGFLRGGTIPQLKAILLGSAEYFQNRAGGSNDGLVAALYRDMLGREPDAGGRQFHTQSLNRGASRTTVAGQFVASREGLERVVQGWYRQFLRRSADAGGLNGLAAFLQVGGREETAVASFFNSGEFTTGL